jgi:hypothetical protein
MGQYLRVWGRVFYFFCFFSALSLRCLKDCSEIGLFAFYCSVPKINVRKVNAAILTKNQQCIKYHEKAILFSLKRINIFVNENCC